MSGTVHTRFSTPGVRNIDSLDFNIRAEQIRLIYRQGPVMVLGATLAATVVATFLWHSVVVDALLLWMSLIVVSALFRIGVFFSFARQASVVVNPAEPNSENLALWGRLFWMGSLLSGTVWGALPILLADNLSLEHLLVISTIFAGMVAVTASAGSIYLPSFYAFSVPMILLLVWVLFQSRVAYLLLTAVLLLLYLFVFALLANRGYRHYVELIQAREHNATLMLRVSAEKSIAESAVVAKNRFMAAASHDLRQPLHALNMFIGSLRSRDSDPERLVILSDMSSATRALGQLLFSLQDLSKLDAGVLEPAFGKVSLTELLRELYNEFAPQADQKGLRLSMNPDPAAETVDTEELQVRSDPVLLERILRNLISNAIRYTETGEVQIQVEKQRSIAHAECVKLTVADSGIGISPEEQEIIFEEYRQLDSAVAAHEQGLGLGLSIVRRFCALLEIPIDLASFKGSGSRFTLTLPLCRSASRSGDNPSANTDGLDNLCVLLVDDEHLVREAVGQCLEGWGCRVLTAASAKEAIFQIAINEQPPAILLCDYRLRNSESGIDVVHAIREGMNQSLPALMVTGDTSAECLQEAATNGMTVIHKPVQEQQLRAAMIESLDQARSGG